MGSVVFLYLCALYFISTVPGASFVKMIQIPERVAAVRGTNVSFICVLPFYQGDSVLQFQWEKEGVDGYLDTHADSRKTFAVKGKGSGFLKLNVSLQDSGVYRCSVMVQGSIIGTGPGSRLTVQVPPTPLRVLSRSSTKHRILVCETTAFYPKDFTLTWYKDEKQITPTSGIKMEETITIEEQNSWELYKVSSSIEDKQSVQIASVYTCLVSHISLKNSAIASYTIPKPNTGSGNKTRYSLWGGCAAGVLAFLVLLIIIGKRCQMKMKNGSKENVTPLGNLEDRMGERAAGDNVAYVTLNLRSSNKTPRPKHQEERTVYAQTKQGAAADKLTYADLDLPRSKKTGKAKRHDKNSEYAEVNIGNYKAAMEAETA